MTYRPVFAGLAAAMCFAAGLAACLDNRLDPNEVSAPGEVLIALNRDFAEFEKWKSYPLPDQGIDNVHLSGPRAVYINKAPPKGSREFPVGTIIVKVAQNGNNPKTAWEVHAMVKRGGGFNAAGARDWEWFDLQFTDQGVPVIRWQGEKPPSGEGYGSAAASNTGDCNSCHGRAWANDYVQSQPLQLPSF